MASRRRKGDPQGLSALAYNPREVTDSSLQKTLTEQRVDHIVGIMCSGQWVTGLTHRQLAQIWGISTTRIENLSAEAHRAIRRMFRESPDAKKEALARLLQSFERLAVKAEAKGSEKGYRDAIEANKMLATLLGVLPAQQIDVTNKTSPFADWTREEKQRFVSTGETPKRASSTAVLSVKDATG